MSSRTGAAAVGAFLALLLLLQGAVLADFPAQEWLYAKEIALPDGINGGELVAVDLDAEVFGGAAGNLSDLRITGGGQESPYHLSVERGESGRTASYSASITDLGHVTGRYTTFVAEAEDATGKVHNAITHGEIEILTSSRDFQRTVTIQSSNDRAEWVTVRENARILDFSIPEPRFKARSTTVSYSPTTARYLRVRIENGEQKPLSISGARIFSSNRTPARETAYPATIIESVFYPDNRNSRITIDLGMAGIPTHRLRIETGDVNFHRWAALEGSSDGETWERLGRRSALYSFATPKFTGAQLELTYSESGHRYLRIFIENEDNDPIVVSAAHVSSVVRRLLFQPQPDTAYRLLYGNENARAPSYDLTRLLPYLEPENAPAARLGPQKPEPRLRRTPAPGRRASARTPVPAQRTAAVADNRRRSCGGGRGGAAGHRSAAPGPKADAPAGITRGPGSFNCSLSL